MNANNEQQQKLKHFFIHLNNFLKGNGFNESSSRPNITITVNGAYDR
jgi:hypothetical protein